MKVMDLTPGDVVKAIDEKATFIGRMHHPYFLQLYLVIWIMDNGFVSLDALPGGQDVGDVISNGRGNLKKALLTMSGTG